MSGVVKSHHTKGVLSLVFLALIFASMGLFVRFLRTDFTVLQQTYVRIGGAFLLSVILFLPDLDVRKIFKLSFKDWAVLIFRATCLYLFGVALFSKALLLTKYSNVSFIGALPITAVLGFLLLNEKITSKKIYYLIVAFFGVLLIAVKDYVSIFSWGKGETITLISGVFFSLSYIARRWHSNILNNKELASIIFLLGAGIVFITSLFMGEGLPTPNGWSFAVWLAVFGASLFNVANLYLTNYGFQHVEAVLASNLLTLEVVFALIFALFFYHEAPSIKELIGGGLIVYSVWGMNKLS